MSVSNVEVTEADSNPISSTPFQFSTAADPNVMLFIDNSASMASILPHYGYSRDETYRKHSYTFVNAIDGLTGSTQPLTKTDDLLSADCPGGYTQANAGVKILCLKLPGQHPYPIHYLDYLFSRFPTHTDLTAVDSSGTTPIPAISIFQSAKNSAIALSKKFARSHFCLSVLGPKPSQIDILQPCSADPDDLLETINQLTLEESDTLLTANSFSNLVRYFADGVDSSTLQPGIIPSPVTYRCQENAIVVFSDHISGDVNETQNTEDTELAQLIVGGFTQDLIGPEQIDASGKSFGKPETINTNGIGDFPLQRVRTFAVVPEFNLEEMEQLVQPGGGNAYSYHQISPLPNTLSRTLTTYRPGNHSVLTMVSSNPIEQTTLLYQTGFNADNWSGSLKAYQISLSQDISQHPAANLLWNARDNIPHHNGRNIFTVSNISELNDVSKSTLIPFRFSQLSTRRVGNQLSEYLVDWVRGDQDQEQRYGGIFRNRDSVLGAIVSANAAVAPGIPSESYSDIDYYHFKQQMASTTRPDTIYVGSNDGLLHGFKAGRDGGRELFGYLSGLLIDDIAETGKPGNKIVSGMDGPITIADARIGIDKPGNPWRTLLVAAPGRGAKGLFALDVTDPGSFVEGDAGIPETLVWEIGSTSHNTDFRDMGYLINPISVIRTLGNDELQHWFVATGNGIGSEFGQSVIYLIDPVSGQSVQSITVSEDSGGITSLTAVDLNGNSYTDRLYGADMNGNIWRLDWNQDTNSFSTALGTEAAPIPMFQAQTSTQRTTSGIPQPITTGLEAGALPGKGYESDQTHGVMIYFGTGKQIDRTNLEQPALRDQNTVQSLYGVWDSNDVKTTHRDQLTELQLSEQSLGNKTVRTMARSRVNYQKNGNRGWAVDLPGYNERVLKSPKLRYGKVQFITAAAPPVLSDPCTSTPQNFIVEVNALNGSNDGEPIFDINQDQKLDEADKSDQGDAPVAVELEPDAQQPAAIEFNTAGGQVLSRISVRNNGTLDRIDTPVKTKRVSWRRIQP